MKLSLFSFKPILSLIISALPIILLIGIIVLIVICIKAKVRIKFHSFFGKSFRAKRGNFGTFAYCGKQGTGKTYSITEYLVDNSKKIKVFSNILNIENVEDITYFKGFKGLMKVKAFIDSPDFDNEGKQLVIVFDEIFTELTKNSKLSQDVLDFLCQMRKRQIIFLTTCQEWAEVPLTFRRFCRYQIDCKMIPILWFTILVKVFKDAENMKWSNDDMEFIAPITETSITKARLKIANSFDTRLRIAPVQVAEVEKTPQHTGQLVK